MLAHLSLGSNVGDREENLRAALRTLKNIVGIRVTATSHCYESKPVGKTDQPAFLNMAVSVETKLTPSDLLGKLKRIEKQLGRTPSERWGPRTIDIDIVLWGDRVFETECLTIPHREFRNRVFVLTPLAEIAAGAVDPVTGKTVAQLAALPEAEGDAVQLATLDL